MSAITTATPLTCANCELEIAGRPEFLVGLAFCCAGCVVGGPCMCSYDLFEDIQRVIDASGPMPVDRAVAAEPTGFGSRSAAPVATSRV